MSTDFVAFRRSVSRWMPGERLAVPVVDPPPDPDAPVIGVLGLQGDVLEHLRALRRCGAHAVTVRHPEELGSLDGLIIPGGESTTIGKLLERFGLMSPLRARIAHGMPVFGTCAGMILLSDALDQDRDQPLIGGLPVVTRRNAFGRQVASFDTRITVDGVPGGPIDVSFIRAPRVESLRDEDVRVLAEVDGYPVVVRFGTVLASAFHPEVTGDDRLHELFVTLVLASKRDHDGVLGPGSEAFHG